MAEKVDFQHDANGVPFQVGFALPVYDKMTIDTYDVNNNPTVISYYALGVKVAELNLAYDGSNRLTSVEKA